MNQIIQGVYFIEYEDRDIIELNGRKTTFDYAKTERVESTSPL